jgi:hypothetical protein
LLRPFLIFGILSAATGACADPRPLAGDALKRLSGSLVEIDTPLGTKLAVRFGSDGLVSAEAGELAPLLGSAKDRGRWWVDGEKLCTKWFRWFDAEVRCITVAQDGARLYWRKDDGETGTASLIEEPAAKTPPVVVAEAPKKIVKEASAKKAAAPEAPVINVASVTAAAPPPVPAPVVVADAAVADNDVQAAPKQPPEEHTIMRFSGEGLREASERVTAPGEDDKTAQLAPPRTPPAETASIDDRLSPLRREQKPEKTVVASVAGPPPRAKAKIADTAAADVAKTSVTRTKKDSVTAPLSAPVAYFRVHGVHRTDVLNVRRGPSENHAPIAAIPSTGRRVEITGRCQDDWCPIRYGRVRGWVNSFYLVAESTWGSSSQSQVYLSRP